MKAVVLAAGEGRRTRPLTYTRPKVMLPVVNKPILEHILEALKKAGIVELVVVVGYHDEKIRDYFGDGARWGVSINYVSQRQQLGTAHALDQAREWVDGQFLMVNGDGLILGEDIVRLMNRKAPAMGLYEVDGGGVDLGMVEVSGEKVTGIHEKVRSAPTKLANTGLYLFDQGIFEAIDRTARSVRGEYEITDSLSLLMGEGRSVYYQVLGYWLNLSYPWDLLNATELLMGGLEPRNDGEVEGNVFMRGPVAIGRGTVVRSGSYIVGPVVIGDHCEVGPNCYIRASTTIGNNCHIGNMVEVKNSIIMSGARVPHFNYVGDSIIGEGCNLGAGTKIANLRLDKKEIEVGGVATHRRKLGAIIGDRVETGINASINVGTLIGNDTFVGPGAVASGIIMPGSRIL
ncbi:MAG: bifunctional sugar-1-phosphate nucleotidylyltransferase/acetyltransferase [Chloroflexota bacterium]